MSMTGQRLVDRGVIAGLVAGLVAGLGAVLMVGATAGAQMSQSTQDRIAETAKKVLAETGVPSASVGVVVKGQVVYAQAFGAANVTPPVPAKASMAYPIGSVSKQFTATAVLLLQQDGKLSIDDPVGKYLPQLTRAKDVTLRNLMTMTSGYEDFAPQDYIIPAWRKPVDPAANAEAWASKPLDFEPGTEWQYSNTNYVLLALIVQKVSGEPFAKFLHDRVLEPLHLQGVFNTYTQSDQLRVTGYVSNAMAKPRVLPLEAPGWYFGDGDLAMPVATLLAWDLGIMHQALLSPASYKEFETPFALKNGKSSNYGLGIDVHDRNGHVELEHSGEVGGYVSENIVYPSDGVAVAVLTNEVASEAAGEIARQIVPLVLPGAMAPNAAGHDTFAPELKSLMSELSQGKVDKSKLTPDAQDYFSRDTLDDFHSTLGSLGEVKDVTRLQTSNRGGMTFGVYRVSFSGGSSVLVSTYLQADGEVEQLLVIGKG